MKLSEIKKRDDILINLLIKPIFMLALNKQVVQIWQLKKKCHI